MSLSTSKIPSFKPSDSEYQARVDLAALYRLFVHYGWTDMIYTHISARVPAEPNHYLINPYGLLFEEINASTLIKVDFAGNVIAGDYPYNEAGHLIHSAVLKARPEINYVLHSHTRAGAAVSAMKCGLLPVSQHANIISATVAYHQYTSITANHDECDYLARDLGSNYLMVMHNHGLLACGRTAAEAFWYLYYLEVACKIQVDLLASGEEPVIPSEQAIEDLQQEGRPGDQPLGEIEWPAMIRLLERKDPSYRD